MAKDYGFCDFSKARNVGGLFYPSDDYTYGRFLEFLDGLQMPCCCSMIHDADKYTARDVEKWIDSHTDKDTGKLNDWALEQGIPDEGQHKKAHVHFMLCANGPMQPKWFAEKIAPIAEHCSNFFISINSVGSTMRYYAHMDTPEKHQYSPLDIHSFGGLDMSPLLKTTKLTNLEVLIKVMDTIVDMGIRHYCILVRWALSTGDVDILSNVTGRASFYANYFKSCHEEEEERRAKEEKERKEAQAREIESLDY